MKQVHRAGALPARLQEVALRRAPKLVVGAEDVEPALKKAFIDHKNDLVFMDFQTNREANVFPMVAAGKGLTDMILAEDL